MSFEAKGANVVVDRIYEEAGKYLIAALEAANATVEFLATLIHTTSRVLVNDSPSMTLLSDIGADTLQLIPDVRTGKADVDRAWPGY